MYLERNSSNPLYTRWLELRRRCRSPRQSSYIKKNISWSEEFDDYMLFREWSMSNGFLVHLSLDRVDNNKGYSPDNCRWATEVEQAYNKNKKDSKNNTSNHKGVSFDKRRNLWRTRIYINNKEKFLGYFTDENDAASAYNRALDDNCINAPRNILDK